MVQTGYFEENRIGDGFLQLQSGVILIYFPNIQLLGVFIRDLTIGRRNTLMRNLDLRETQANSRY